MKTMLDASLISLLIMQPLTAADMPHYTVTLDVYVRDEQSLCKRAWQLAIADHGPVTAETLTMHMGEFSAVKCLAVVFQKAASGEIVSAGIEVTQR